MEEERRALGIENGIGFIRTLIGDHRAVSSLMYRTIVGDAPRHPGGTIRFRDAPSDTGHYKEGRERW